MLKAHSIQLRTIKETLKISTKNFSYLARGLLQYAALTVWKILFSYVRHRSLCTIRIFTNLSVHVPCSDEDFKLAIRQSSFEFRDAQKGLERSHTPMQVAPVTINKSVIEDQWRISNMTHTTDRNLMNVFCYSVAYLCLASWTESASCTWFSL